MVDRDYYRMRAEQEQVRAATAHCQEGQRIHDELAARYRLLATDDRPRLVVVASS